MQRIFSEGDIRASSTACSSELGGINHAVFLGAENVYACDEIATGLRNTEVIFGEEAEIGGLSFCYEARSKLVLTACGVVVEFDFEGAEALGADLYIGGAGGGLKYFLNGGIIKTL